MESSHQRYVPPLHEFIQRTLTPCGASEFAGLSSLKDWRSLFLARQRTTYCIHLSHAESRSLLKGLIHKYSAMLKHYWLRVCAVIYCAGDIAFTPAIIYG